MRNITWKKRNIMISVLAAALLCAVCTAGILKINEGAVQQGIARSVIRFHVLANSNSQEDQDLKMQVKADVVEEMQGMLKGARSVEESRSVIEENLPQIQSYANERVKEYGYDYPVSAGLVTTWFPVKEYGDCTFPAGQYEALQIRIGEAEGRNWWCVLYPGLCFTDAVHAVVPEEKKEELSHVLTDDEYETIMNGGRVKVRFRWFS
ncbi:stage II sporulation protein R [Ruminococcus gauvreauii]|uniref:Stage II sporulation protein R n=1 Tax=Ruminococcus gauvreauii TaxID=438033 RepID=A0ABY5VLS3_9FIRM|nr:stage II sporulation protein R [Ruminococcus gauvreauii]UWP60936.1 stage II sporulation protein R [Ruminococcus gauvreauii]